MTWLTIKELAGLQGTYPRKAQRWAKGNADTRYVSGIGRGGKVLQVSLESLPQDLQKKYFSQQSSEDIPQNEPPRQARVFGRGGPFGPTTNTLPARAASNVIPLPERRPAPVPASKSRRKPLTPWQEKTALAMADLVRYMREARARAKRAGQRKTRAAEDAMALYNNGFILQEVFNALGTVALKTVYTWDKKLRRAGNDYRALAPRHGEHRRGRFSLTDIERDALLRAALRSSAPCIGKAIDWANAWLSIQFGMGFSASEATCRRFLEAYKKENYHVWVLAREGEKALDDKVNPYIQRDASLLEVGEVLVADGHPLNFFVINPWTGKPCRAVLVAFFDWASRYPCGFEIMLTEDVQCIQSAFRRAVMALGKLPRHAVIDNGKAFKAKVFTNPDRVDFEQAGIHGLYARLGIKVRFSRAYNAKDKPVERFFREFLSIEQLMPSYCGSDIQSKPPHMKRNEKFHKAMHNPFIPTIAQAIELVDKGLDLYRDHPHSGLDGKTPREVFLAGRGPGIDPGELNHMMMFSEVKTIYRNGIRLFGKDNYYWDEALYGYKGKVLVKYDLSDLREVLVYTDQGEFLCRARQTHKFDPLMRGNDRAALKERMKQKKQLVRDTKRIVKAVNGIGEPLPGLDWQKAVAIAPDLPEAVEQATDEAAAEQSDVAALIVEQGEHEEPFFQSEYERYEHLLSREPLTDEEREFMQWYESTEEYQTIFVDLRQAL